MGFPRRRRRRGASLPRPTTPSPPPAPQGEATFTPPLREESPGASPLSAAPDSALSLPASHAGLGPPPYVGGYMWNRACRLLVLLILVMVPLLYPLRLPDGAIEAIEGHRDAWWYPLYSDHLYAFLNYGYSPLPLKETAFSILVLALVFCWLGRVVAAGGFGSHGQPQSRDWRFYGPIIALLAWSAASLLYSPTFYWSLTTFALTAMGLLWLIAVAEIPKTPRTVRRWFNAILFAGFAVALVAFLQDTDGRRLITGWFLVDIERLARTEPTYLRLRMGSLIGHNIGTAAFLTFSWFILLARMFQRSPWRHKALWAAMLALLGYVIAASQTRGIWLVLAALTPLHLVWLVRLTGVRVDVKMILGVVLIVLILLTLQIIPSPRNPFYSPESPLLVRFTHFSPQHLLTETRLRIAVCSTPLIARQPLRGHGLGSFQYAYPPAQADYFAAHPNTVLSPTHQRTVQAHSDWLQLIVELGLPGLLIVLAGLYVMLRRGWDSWQRLRNPALRLELTAALMGVAGVMIHALADFPGHVVSSVSPALFLLGVWTNCGRIERAGRPVSGSVIPSDSGTTPAVRRNRLAGTLALLLLLPAMMAMAAWFHARLQASMHESLGTSFRVYYGDHASDPDLTYAQKRRTLMQAEAELKKAHRIVPLDGQVIFRLGEVAALHGVLNVMDAMEARTAGTTVSRVRELVRSQEADLLLREAIARLTDCQNEIRYHEVFHYLGMAYENLYALHGVPEDRQEARKCYGLSVRYSPSFGRSLYRLFILMQKDRPPNIEEMQEVCRKLAYFDPALFDRQFIQPVLKANERRDYKQVALKADVLREVMPARYDFWLLKIHAVCCTGGAKEAAALLDEFARAFPQIDARFLSHPKMEIAAALGRWDGALREADAALALREFELFHPAIRCVRALALEKLGRPEAKTAWEEIERLGPGDPRYFCGAADLFYFLAPDRARAYEYALKYCRASELILPSVIRMAAELAFERGEKAQGVELLERALKLDPEDPLALALLKSVKP